jgi:hypothetical protein
LLGIFGPGVLPGLLPSGVITHLVVKGSVWGAPTMSFQPSGILLGKCPRRDTAPIMPDENLSLVTKMFGLATHIFDQKLRLIRVHVAGLLGERHRSHADRATRRESAVQTPGAAALSPSS